MVKSPKTRELVQEDLHLGVVTHSEGDKEVNYYV